MVLTNHLSADLLEVYRQRRLEPAQLLALDDHLASCSECRERLREITPTYDALLSLRANLVGRKTEFRRQKTEESSGPPTS
jgi:anti-sigma factor RsiW